MVVGDVTKSEALNSMEYCIHHEIEWVSLYYYITLCVIVMYVAMAMHKDK